MKEKMNEITPTEQNAAVIVTDQLNILEEFKARAKACRNKAVAAKVHSEEIESKKTNIIFNKEAIVDLKENQVKLGEAIYETAEAQQASFEYQTKLAEMTRYLFNLSASSIAMTRAIIKSLSEKLNDAAHGSLDEKEKEEIIRLISELKEREDIMSKDEKLSLEVKSLADSVDKLSFEVKSLADSAEKTNSELSEYKAKTNHKLKILTIVSSILAAALLITLVILLLVVLNVIK